MFIEAHIGEKVIATLYGLSIDDRFTFLMMGFDPVCARVCPGHNLIARTIEVLMEKGIRHFDFKYGKESYKQHWGSQCYEKFDVDIFVSWPGRLLRPARFVALGLASLIQVREQFSTRHRSKELRELGVQ